MAKVHKQHENEVEAQAAALRALASYLEYLKSIQDIEDPEEYTEKLEMYVKGAGSTFLDEIDATGAYARRIPAEQDPNFIEYINSITMMSVHGMQSLYDPTGFAAILGKLVNLDFCTLLRQEVVKRIEEKKEDDGHV